MVFEDVHWIDPSSRELLDLIVERVRRLHVLVIITFRQEFSPPWVGLPHVTFRALSRLGSRDGAAVIANLAAGKAVPPQVVEQIFERADGVPLFLEELTKTVLESPHLREAAGSHALTKPLPPLAIPLTLQASLMARLDRLESGRGVAQTAAVIGREFSHALIAAVASLPESDLRHALNRLADAELIFCRGVPPDASYVFKHALILDAAYSSLLRSRRQQLHKRIAQVLEEEFPQVAEVEPEVLARHYTEAGQLDRAIEKWEVAGHRERARSAQHEAAAHFREAACLIAELPDSDEQRAREATLLLWLGQALFGALGGGAPETIAAFVRAKDLARELGDRDVLCRAAYGASVAYTLTGRFDAPLALAAEVSEVAERDDDDLCVAVAARVCCGGHTYRGELLEAERRAERGMVIFRRDDVVGRADTGFAHHPILTIPATLGLVTWALGRPDQALRLTEESLAAAEARLSVDENSVAYLMVWISFVHVLRRSPQEAIKYTAKLRRFTEERGSRFWNAVADWQEGAALIEMGQFEGGLSMLQAGAQRFFAVGSRQHEPFIRQFEARAHMELGRLSDAAGCLAEAQQAIDETNQRFYEPEQHRLMGRLNLTRGDRSDAKAHYRRAIDIARSQAGRSWELRAATDMARFWRDQGKRAKAHDLLAPVYGWFTEGFDTGDLIEAKVLLNELISLD
jgi:tetratricopeptide (TPR) repeat protein